MENKYELGWSFNTKNTNEVSLLENNVLEKIAITSDKLGLKLGDKWLVIPVGGDCCSSSYYNDLFMLGNIIGKKIVSIEEISLEGDKYKDKKLDYDLIQYYGLKFNAEDTESEFGTVSNNMVVSFRNESNGYYGGYIDTVYVSETFDGKEVVGDITDVDTFLMKD
jgi:hypothetical protein